MSYSSSEEIRRCFLHSVDFNELFDAFESAIAQSLQDIELYKPLFWNNTLTPDEVRLFGEKLAIEFPALAYDVFFWLAKVFEATQSSSDNFELAFQYYRKAAKAEPAQLAPYRDAAACYESDLDIPPLSHLIEFVQSGITSGADPVPLYYQLAHLHELAGEPAVAEYYRQQAEHASEDDDAAQ